MTKRRRIGTGRAPTGRLGALAVAVLACGLVLGCGSGDGGDGTQEAPPQQAEARQEEAAAGTEADGDEQGAAAGSREGLPGWLEVNDSRQTVSMSIVAGETPFNSNWNYNGYARGNATITVPAGYEVTIEFANEDPAVAHSLGIDEKPDRWPATFGEPEPVFEGAITSNPTSMSQGTMPGESETITFTADREGEYAMVCYIPGHASAGMWIRFHVSSDGSAGFSADTAS